MKDNGPKDRKFTFNESGDEIAYTVLLRRHNALNCQIRLTKQRFTQYQNV